MKYLFTLFFLQFVLISLGQIEVSQTTINYGIIDHKTDRVIDLTVTNNSDESTFLLRNDFSNEYDFLFSKRTIDADSTITLRIKYNPRKKGKKNDKVQLWFSTMNEPIILKIKAEVEYVDDSLNPACPDFNARPIDCCSGNEIIFEMIDVVTKKEIHKGQIRLVNNGELTHTMMTDRSGNVTQELPISYYYILADAIGYLPADSASYINRQHNYFLFEMTPQKVEIAEEIVEEKKEEIEEEAEVILIKNEDEEVIETIRLNKDEDEILPESLYAKNNIVFLIDVSSSMNSKGKLDILKNSMYELVDALRSVDQLTVITYAAQPKVILKTQSVSNKREIKELIKQLETGGMTSGAKGFSKAFALAKKNYVDDGNNQIIVATDGAFKVSDHPKILKLIKKNKRKVKTTVIGIKSNGYAAKKLSEFSEEGNGSYLQVDDFDEAKTILIQEIMKQSRITRE